ncbi:DegT/DnrJ/EryC1/StrS family aminotransferase, partial [Flavobacterium sp.]|uniref:DegT/DnrJ/EryC1/StrS family aminotransferase n=1 Tax=Flavobacterium sp. TaxID=239 RepID=UPI0037BE38C7
MIKFLDLQKINAPHEALFQEKLKTFLNKGWYILGNEVEIFEKNFAHYCGTKYCIGVANGLDALTLIFRGYIALGKLQKGDEVIVPANTYIASILAILEAGLIPILVEPDEITFNLNPKLIPNQISPKTKAILVVHLYGQLADMQQINAIAEAHNLLIVEDAAQAHGCHLSVGSNELGVGISQFGVENEQQSKLLSLSKAPSLEGLGRLGVGGGFGGGSAYSFYPSKNLGALGDAGAITTNDAELAKVLFSLRNYGSEVKYHNDYMGVNSRLDELQAAFLNVKLPHLDQENKRRRKIAQRYLSEIKNPKIGLPFYDNSQNHVFHLFVIRTKNRTELQNYLTENGIQTQIHYPIPPHKQKALKDFNHLSFP